MTTVGSHIVSVEQMSALEARRWRDRKRYRIRLKTESPEQRELRLQRKREAQRLYRLRHPERAAEADAYSQEKHRDEINYRRRRRYAMASQEEVDAINAKIRMQRAKRFAAMSEDERAKHLQRRKELRAAWIAKNPEQNAKCKRRWFAKNPGYRTQWARDKRAEAPKRVLKTPEEKKATKREYDRRYYAEHREEKLAIVRERRGQSAKVDFPERLKSSCPDVHAPSDSG